MNNIKKGQLDPITRPMQLRELSAGLLVRTAPLTITITAILYAVWTIGAEVMTIFVGVLSGAFLYALLILCLVNGYYFSRSFEARRMYLAFILLPLLRILSLSVPIPNMPPIYSYVLIGIPLLVSAVFAVRANGLSSLRLNLTWWGWAGQLLFGLCGISLGVIASFILKRTPVISQPSLERLLLGGLVLALFSGVTEEILFRGLLLKALSYPFGLFGFFFSSVLYASMFLGTLSVENIIFFGLTGLVFAFWVQISDSLWGVILAHSLMNIVLLLLFSLH